MSRLLRPCTGAARNDRLALILLSALALAVVPMGAAFS